MHKILSALANEVRLNIMVWLANPYEYFDGDKYDLSRGVCVGLIQKKAGLSQPAISQNLAILEAAGLVNFKKEGQWRHYCCNPDSVKTLVEFLETNLVKRRPIKNKRS